MKSLFNEEIPDIVPKKVLGKYKIFKANNHYQKSKNPDRQCPYCKHFLIMQTHEKKYFKCKIMGNSSSSASDIRDGHVCDLFIE